MSAMEKIVNGEKRKKEDADPKERLFIHMKYHPRGITRRQIRAAFDTTCNNFHGTAAETKQATVAFSQPTNLKVEDKLTSARFYPNSSRWEIPSIN